MKQPYWIINKETIKAWRESNWSLFKLIYVWIKIQLFFFYSLHFKKCNNKGEIGSHFWDGNMFCLRCKRTKYEIDRNEYFWMKIRNE